MARDTCRYPSCDNETREHGELKYPDQPEKTASNGERFRVSRFGAKFCSTKCELKHEHIKADARDAARSEGRR
jgi:hypothetical protein